MSILRLFEILMGGEMPNSEMPTMGGKFFWETIREEDAYKLQVNKVDGHARILDGADDRVAWGTLDAMKKRFLDFIAPQSRELKTGDIICVDRENGLYEHYAVYIGNDKVIHYASENGDFGGRNTIHEAPMSEFLRGSNSFFILDFPDNYGKPTMIKSSASVAMSGVGILENIIKSSIYHLYSPEETVRRAKSRIGEGRYNLATNNCEHFAIWCKTGISESHQVNSIISNIEPTTIIKA